jgi:hypothetical protein
MPFHLEEFRSNDPRHEAVSRFVEAGLSDEEVFGISSDKSLQMLKRYIRPARKTLYSSWRTLLHWKASVMRRSEPNAPAVGICEN